MDPRSTITDLTQTDYSTLVVRYHIKGLQVFSNFFSWRPSMTWNVATHQIRNEKYLCAFSMRHIYRCKCAKWKTIRFWRIFFEQVGEICFANENCFLCRHPTLGTRDLWRPTRLRRYNRVFRQHFQPFKLKRSLVVCENDDSFYSHSSSLV